MPKKSKPKIIAIVGPTATGKSALAVELARVFDGEVVSADSRQVYRKLDLGTGKITQREMRGIPHHLLDVADPKRQFSVAQYKKLADHAIADILERGKVPIICGGTGLYVDAITKGLIMPEVPPDKQLRTELSRKTPGELLAMLKKLDPRRAREIDTHNPVRLIRAVEVARELGVVPRQKASPLYDCLIIGLDMEDTALKERVLKRLVKRLHKGMIAEARRLHEHGVSWKRMEALGLEYRFLAHYLQGKVSREQLKSELAIAIWHYVKRQRTWWKRDRTVHWLAPQHGKEAARLIRTFLNDQEMLTLPQAHDTVV